MLGEGGAHCAHGHLGHLVGLQEGHVSDVSVAVWLEDVHYSNNEMKCFECKEMGC